CTNKLPFCHLFHRFSVTMEPHCALKASKYLLKNINCYHHNANDRFGFKTKRADETNRQPFLVVTSSIT
ncbi:MAG: hypothetical protein K5899_12290, partial [Bacteroidaceae bacterium]|nr:hypothetical protein [Bacteroidaceae bacterium]